MGQIVVRLGADQYVKWSNTTDSPISHVMRRDEILDRLQSEDHMSFEQAKYLLDVVVDGSGTSDPGTDLETVLATNCAGSGGETLTIEEILSRYRKIE
jgi:hypothetical protein